MEKLVLIFILRIGSSPGIISYIEDKHLFSYGDEVMI